MVLHEAFLDNYSGDKYYILENVEFHFLSHFCDFSPLVTEFTAALCYRSAS